jgi:Tfp pilus assembly protein PilF
MTVSSKITSALLALLLASTAAHAQLPPGTQDASQPKSFPDAQGRLRTEANHALEKQDYPRALKLLLNILEQSSPDTPDPHLLYDLAYTQDALDQTSNAEASYRRAIAAGPNLLEPHLGLGLLLARTDLPTEAHAELASAVSLPTDDPALKARAYRALARLDLNSSPDAARDELLLALKLSPETPEDTLMAAELAEAANDPVEAQHAYRRLLAETPNEPAATAALAHLLSSGPSANPVEAESLLTAALAVHPGQPTLTAQLATLYADQGKFAQAVPLAEKLHAANPADTNLTRLLAHLYSQSGEPAKADPLYAALLSAHSDPTLLDDRAAGLIHLHQFAEAEALLKQALANPAAFPNKDDLGMAASHLAFAASSNNDPLTTLRALDIRATVLPQSAPSLFLAATAHDKLHEYKQAADLYTRFIAEANGKFPDEEFEARHRLIAISSRK